MMQKSKSHRPAPTMSRDNKNEAECESYKNCASHFFIYPLICAYLINTITTNMIYCQQKEISC